MRSRLSYRLEITDIEMGKANVRDFAYHLVEKIKTLPKEPNGHSQIYDENMMINIVESYLENYLSDIK